MKCLYCGAGDSKVIDSRPTDDGEKIRRRRECLKCNKRFTTFEIIETTPIIIIKKDKSRETFDSQKLLTGMLKACEKRPVPFEVLEKAVSNIEQYISSKLEREITSVELGELTMNALKKIDEVAYVRFASVYRQFSDINTFMTELTELLSDKQKNNIDNKN